MEVVAATEEESQQGPVFVCVSEEYHGKARPLGGEGGEGKGPYKKSVIM